MKKWILVAIIGVVLVVVAIVILARPTAVEVGSLQERELVERLVVTGQVEPQDRAELSVQVGGKVIRLAAREGDEVQEGDILIELDGEEAEASLRQAEASLRRAQARQRSVTGQQAPSSLRDLEEATLNFEAATEELARTRELVENGVATQAELDQRRRDVERARLAVERSRIAVEEAGQSGSAAAEAFAAVQEAQAARDLASLALANHTLRAPFSGQILRREVNRGQSVQAGAVLFLLGSQEGLEILIEPDEREISHLRRGLPALVVADAFPEIVMEAAVDRIDPSVDRERATIRVYLRLISTPPEGLLPDMTVSADIELRREKQATVVPTRAIRGRAQVQPFVLVIDDGRATRRDVQIGLRSDEFIEIVEGLSKGEEIILSQDVEPGERVSP